MQKILFVINPISGGIGKRNIRQDIDAACKHEPLKTKFMETTGDEDQRKIQEEIDAFGPEIVVACGGDGTINLVAQVLLENDLTLGIIPMGSANGMATELEIPTNIQQAVKILFTNRVKKIDVLVINEKHISLHLADIGFNAKLIKRFEEAGKRGKIGYAKQFIKILFTQASMRFYFLMNDETFSKRAQMVTFANARKYGTGAVVNPDGRLDDGKFEVCIFRPYPWYALFGIGFRFFTGSLKKSKYVKIYSTKDVTVYVRNPEVLQVDGEALGEYKEVHVAIHPKKIPVLIK